MSSKRAYLLTLKPMRPEMPFSPTEKEIDSVSRHFQRLVRLKEEGVLVLAGRTTEGDVTGIAVFYAETDDEAEAFMKEDPCIAEGVMTGKVEPFGIAIH